MANGRYEQHKFFCPKCGQENYSLSRNIGHKYSKFHRKKLWCYHCKQELNCIECRTDMEIQEFKEKWAAGEFEDEVAESIRLMEEHKKIWS